ncbi:hypothetical protein BH18ACI4_BH18ACI4_19870 [soil metagenome]
MVSLVCEFAYRVNSQTCLRCVPWLSRFQLADALSQLFLNPPTLMQ